MTLERRHLALLVPLAFLAAIAALLPSLPNADYWSRFAARYFLAEDHWQGLRAALWVAENGHRNPLGQLVYLLNYHLLSGSNYGLFGMTAVSALATGGFLAGALRSARGARPGDVPIVFLLVLSPAAVFHWVSPMSGTHWLLTDALFAASVWALARYATVRRRRYAALACGAAMLAAFAFTTGVAALALISVALVHAAPRKGPMLLALAALNAGFYGAFFAFVFGFTGKTPAAPDIARWAAFFLSTAGGYFSAKPFGIAPSILLGTTLIAAWSWVLRRLSAAAGAPALLVGLIGGYALFNLALIAFGRHEMALTVSLTTRYGNISSWLVLALVIGWLELGSSRPRRWLRWAPIAILIGAGYLKGIAELAVYHHPFLARAPLDRLALMLQLPEFPGPGTYLHFSPAPGLAEALRRDAHVPFSRFDKPIPMGAAVRRGDAVAVSSTVGARLPTAWDRIEFRSPDLPSSALLVDETSLMVIGAAVRIGDRYVGYARPRREGLLAVPSPDDD